jgi:hypothetical protein
LEVGADSIAHHEMLQPPNHPELAAEVLVELAPKQVVQEERGVYFPSAKAWEVHPPEIWVEAVEVY